MGVALMALCEPHCAHPCTELNGDVEFECGDCTPALACYPGAEGYDKSYRRQSGHPGMDAMRMEPAKHRVAVEPSTGATSSFRSLTNQEQISF